MTFSPVRETRKLMKPLIAGLCAAGMFSTQPALAANWSAPKILSTYTLLALPTNLASVAVSNNGDAVAVWINEADFTVQYARRKLGVWSAARVLYRPSSLNGETTADAQVAMAPDGSATAIFATTTPGKLQYCVVGNRVVRCLGPSSSYAKVARLAAGATSWSKPAAVSAKGIAVAGTRIGVDNGGNAVAAWTYIEKAGAPTQLQSASASVNGVWSAPLQRYSGNSILFVQLAVDGAGDVALAWQQRDTTIAPYRVRMLLAPVGQADVIVDAATLAAQATGLRTGIDDSGAVHAVWNDGYGISRVRCVVASGCDTPQPVTSAAGWSYGLDAYAYAADLAVAGNGDVLIAWTEMNAATGEWSVIGQLYRGADVATSFQAPVDAQLGVPFADVELCRDGSAGMVGWVDYGSGAVQVERWDAASDWTAASIGSAVWGSQVVLGSGENAQGSAVWIASTPTEFRYRTMAGSVVF